MNKHTKNSIKMTTGYNQLFLPLLQPFIPQYQHFPQKKRLESTGNTGCLECRVRRRSFPFIEWTLLCVSMEIFHLLQNHLVKCNFRGMMMGTMRSKRSHDQMEERTCLFSRSGPQDDLYTRKEIRI